MVHKYELDPITNASLYLQLYRNVDNMPSLLKKLLTGNLQCCIIKPTLILDPFQIVVAANKALLSEKMTTRTVYTEILFNLSISKNITQSLRRFGAVDKDTNILVVVVSTDRCGGDSVVSVMKEVVGEVVDISELSNFANCAEIKKVYNIGELEVGSFPLLDSIVSRIATKDCI